MAKGYLGNGLGWEWNGHGKVIGWELKEFGSLQSERPT
jgi:hypothetical protein